MIRRRKTGNLIFLGILFTCSVGAIGFSSWMYGDSSENKSDFSDIKVDVGVIEDYRDCIAINDSKPNGGVQPLLFCSTGFVNSTSSSNNVPSYLTKGYIEVDLKLDLNKIKTKISTTSIYLYETLSLADSGGNTTNFSNPTAYLKYLGSDIVSTGSSDSNNVTWSSSHILDSFNTLTSETGEIEVTLKYELVTKNSTAYKRFYDYLTSTSTNPKLVLTLNLGEVNA